jgi:membrane protein DedA with SNARE-associated domain
MKASGVGQALFNGTRENSMFSTGGPISLITKYGYWAVAGVIGLESMGLPLPGEATLIAAGIYAGSTQHLNIWMVIAAASAGAILGDNLGFWIGREIGFRLLLRYGGYVRLTESRIKLGQYLFQRHGGKIVFFGRFIPLLRVLAALLAGVNQMSWPRFLQFNVAGGILWATLYGLGAYYLGQGLEHLTKRTAPALAGVGVIALIIALVYLRRHQAELEAEAERAIPGPPRRRRLKSSGLTPAE